MKQTLTYKNINPLPTLTWNWLKINRAALEYTGDISADGYSVSGSNKDLPSISGITKGVTVTEHGAAIAAKLPPVAGGSGKDADDLMNTLGVEPVVIASEKNTSVEKPVTIHFDLKNKSASAFRQIIKADDDSSITVIMDYTSAESSAGFHAVQTKLYAGARAHIHLIKVQLLGSDFTQLDDTGCACEDGGSVDVTQIILGGGKTYAGVQCALSGTASSFNSDTAYLCRDKQNLDMNYNVIHTGRNTSCTMHVKGVLDGESTKIYRGTIDFKHGCAGAKGDEQEETLLLSPKTINKTIPLILCDEEDVEGTHGATIGRLGADELFYMESRGVSEEAAEKMMSRARIASVAHLIPDENVIAEIESFIDKAFDNE